MNPLQPQVEQKLRIRVSVLSKRVSEAIEGFNPIHVQILGSNIGSQV